MYIVIISSSLIVRETVLEPWQLGLRCSSQFRVFQTAINFNWKLFIWMHFPASRCNRYWSRLMAAARQLDSLTAVAWQPKSCFWSEAFSPKWVGRQFAQRLDDIWVTDISSNGVQSENERKRRWFRGLASFNDVIEIAMSTMWDLKRVLL